MKRASTDRRAEDTTEAVTAFEAARPALFGLAYRMLGSAADAQDVLQDAFLRWENRRWENRRQENLREQTVIDNPRAYLTTTVARLCLDVLKSARRQRETYVGPWLPEPIRTDLGQSDTSRAERESISIACMTLLERLSPRERAVFVLHEAFEHSHAQVGELLDMREAAVRQTLRRARERLRANAPRFCSSAERHASLVGAFLFAAGTGDMAALTSLLADDVRTTSDGGGKVTAARRVVLGPDRNARLWIGLFRHMPAGLVESALVELNGWPSVLVRLDGRPFSALCIEADDARIHAFHLILNPDKLTGL